MKYIEIGFSPGGERVYYSEMTNKLDISVSGDYLLKYESALRGLFKEIPFIHINEIQHSARNLLAALNYHDISIDVIAGAEEWKLLIETKWTGEPRLARQACLSLLSSARDQPYTYPIFAAPYIGPQSSQICKDLNVGYIDLAGNCHLVFGSVFISRENFPNANIEKRQLKSLFSAKASRIIRTMLEEPQNSWHVIDLAKTAQVSIGLVSKVKQKLFDLEYAISEDGAFKLNNPELVLKNWSKEYSYKDNEILYCYSPEHTQDNEQKLGSFCTEQKIKYALTLFSGAAVRAPSFYGVLPASAYVNTDPKKVAQFMNWREVTSGANIILLKPYDDFILQDKYPVERGTLPIVSDIQLYLDLMSYGGRAEDAAEFLLEHKLRAKWQ